MKILLFGRGVISTQYAWALAESGHRVTFFVREGKAKQLGKTVALNILDARKKITGKLIRQNWKIDLTETLHTDHDYDLIFVSVQHYQLESALEFLKGRIANATLLLFNNVWAEPLEVIKAMPRTQTVFGFPAAGGGFDNDGQLNGAFMPQLTIGTFGTPLTTRDNQIIKMFKEAGFKVKITEDFRSWLLGHFVVNAAMHLETLQSSPRRLTTGLLKSTNHWRNIIRNGKTLIPILQGRNVELQNSPDLKLFNLPPWILSLTMRIAFKFLPPVRMIFAAHNNEYELKSYVTDVLKTADELKISLPKFQAAQVLIENETTTRHTI